MPTKILTSYQIHNLMDWNNNSHLTKHLFCTRWLLDACLNVNAVVCRSLHYKLPSVFQAVNSFTHQFNAVCVL